MARIAIKFGGSSLADLERIAHCARHVKREIDAGHQLAVVVSAMGGTTDQLARLCREASAFHDAREYDAVVASGEQVSAGLMAIILQRLGVNARSWQAWQAGVRTDSVHAGARITAIDGAALGERIKAGQVPVICGFQGVTQEGRISTLGRGGSDTSAVAVAAAIGADQCDIYTDVRGVFTTDPRTEASARLLRRISFEEILEMASLGSHVLHVRAIELAMRLGVRILVRSSFDDPDAPPGPENAVQAGTVICDERDILEKQMVTGISFTRDESQISLRGLKDRPGVAAAVLGPLAESNINVDMIVQSVSADGTAAEITFTLPAGDREKALQAIDANRASIGECVVESTPRLAKISVIGIGMRSHAGIAARGFDALAQKGINIRAISTSEIKYSILIDDAFAELAVRVLHAEYGLDAPDTG